jgi:protein arginine N-methyltransferase 1
LYTLGDYLWMVADRARVEAYAGALGALVRPGWRVVDVGAGFGFFSVIAARAGAARVDAVDTNPAVHLGPKVAAANACASRIVFHHRDVRQLTLDTRADLLILDLRGPTPFGRRALEVLIDARERLLRPGGAIVAARDTVLVAPARVPSAFRTEVQSAHAQAGMALDPVERIVYDTPLRCTVDAGDLLAPAVPWIELDYGSIDRTDAEGSVRWTFDRPGRVEGLALWFTTDLGAGFGFSTGPGGSVHAYRQMFIPFRSAVDVSAGEPWRVRLGARQAGDSYLWQWQVWRQLDASEALLVDQNSLAEVVLDTGAFPPSASGTLPELGSRGRALHRLLGLMDGSRTIARLAVELGAERPDLFRDTSAAMEFATKWTAEMDRLERGAE